MSGRVSQGTGLTRVGDFELLKKFAAPVTKQGSGILSAAVEVQAQPDDEDLTYMPRELVQCTLPHSDPSQVSFWKRTNGNLTLSIVSDYDPQTGKLVGYLYGSIPRLNLFWLTTEALRTGSPRLELGRTTVASCVTSDSIQTPEEESAAMPYGFATNAKAVHLSHLLHLKLFKGTITGSK